MDLDGNGDGSVDNSGETGYNYSKEQYERFGWAREAGAITKEEMDDLESKVNAVSSLARFNQSTRGEAIVEVNNDPKTTLGVDNVFAFITGEKDDYIVTRTVRFNAETEAEMEIFREVLYEGRTFSGSYLEIYKREGLAREYRREDYPRFTEYQKRRSDRATSRGANQDNRLSNVGGRDFRSSARSPLTPVVKTFTDIAGRERNVLQYGNRYRIEGDVRSDSKTTPEAAIEAENERIISRYARKYQKTKGWMKLKIALDERFLQKERSSGKRFSLPLDDSYVDNGVPYVGGTNMGVGEMRKRIANSTHYKVYSKSRMLETVKNLPGAGFLNGKTLATLADSMWTSFNAITSTEQADAYVSDMARAVSDKQKKKTPQVAQDERLYAFRSTCQGVFSF